MTADFRALQRDCFDAAVHRGLLADHRAHPQRYGDEVYGWLMHAVSEIGEVFGALRGGAQPTATWYRDGSSKPEGVPSELADVVLCIGTIAEALGVDLGAAVAEKMAYNRIRVPDAVPG